MRPHYNCWLPTGNRSPNERSRHGRLAALCAIIVPIAFQLKLFWAESIAITSSSRNFLPKDPFVWPSGDISSSRVDIRRELPLRLEVPYYVYENETLNWYNAKWNTKEYGSYKHSEDWHLLKAALRHPRRTQDPSKAKLFFVPTLLNAAASMKGERPKICVGPKHNKCFRENKGGFYEYVNQALGEQYWFQKNQGKDHVIVASHWAVGLYYGRHTYAKSYTKPNLFRNLRSCNVINRQGLKPTPYDGRYALASAYVGNPCPPQRTKASDFTMIASLHPGNPDFQSRRDICEWISTANDSAGSEEKKYSVAVCGHGLQCPALAQARFGFHVRGDSWGSNRVMDTFLSRTVPLFTNDFQYDILPPLVPWRKLTYLISVNNSREFYDSMDDVLSRKDAEYENLLTAIDYYMPIFNHTTIYRFDAYMAEFAKLQGIQKAGAPA